MYEVLMNQADFFTLRPVYTFTVLTKVRYGLSRFPKSWRTVMNCGQIQVFYGYLRITTVLLRFPTTSVRCFYEFMPDCARYDHGRSRFITAVLRSVTVLLRFDTVLLRFLTVVLWLITMPLRFDMDGAGICTVIDGRATVDYGLLRDGVNKLHSIHIKLSVLLRHSAELAPFSWECG